MVKCNDFHKDNKWAIWVLKNIAASGSPYFILIRTKYIIYAIP